MGGIKKFLKWTAIGVLGLALVLFLYSEYLIKMAPEAVPVTLVLPTDAASLEEGERLSRTMGCVGCHEKNLEGQVFFDEPIFARVVAPNISGLFHSES
ncbi:MAG: hypothetical protein V3R20_01240, partial [Sphingomonadales bacterium]